MRPSDEEIQEETEKFADAMFGKPKEPIFNTWMVTNTANALRGNPTRADCAGAADMLDELGEYVNGLEERLATIRRIANRGRL